ncbi:hypothetical protein [Flavobacterium hydatis]|uniref:Lipoprotein n=1 Tax=Flavobacterium hydatis TaxID=991 RepID=A0A086AUD5_FLAHY|nr:hypothetical protein [Flavobacterium hydatis]KFF20299.1 hypothetical protein IW20_00640 [Flavobacterium hydatis]OXA98412.1 hypothetical protein B0A62_01020 [Flavobacterium hydatis]
MKNKLQRITQVLLCSFLLIILGCETEKLVTDEQTPQTKNILSAKTWFDKYESNGINYELFQNLEYNWNEANLTKSEDGTETIIVPINELKKDQTEIWSQKLYLYKLGAGAYKALLFEIYPDKDVPSGSQTIEEGNFNGYMAAWDLKTGFVRASRFKNNQVVENGIVAVVSIDKKTGKAPAILPCVDDMCQTGPGGLGDPVQLRNVNIPPKNTSTPPNGAPSAYFGPRTPVTGGTNPSGFTSPGGGGGGSGTVPPTTTVNPCESIKNQNLNPEFKAKMDVLKTKTSLKKESGFAQKKDGTFKELQNGSGGTNINSLEFTIEPDIVGYMHVHIDPYENGKYDEDGNPEQEAPIKMFSPADVQQFLLLLINAKINKIPIENIFGTMVSSTGDYTLRFTGNIEDVKTDYNWGALKSTYKAAIKKDGNELGFLKFLNDNIGIKGISLYKIKKDGKSENKTLDANNKLNTTPCQ